MLNKLKKSTNVKKFVKSEVNGLYYIFSSLKETWRKKGFGRYVLWRLQGVRIIKLAHKNNFHLNQLRYGRKIAMSNMLCRSIHQYYLKNLTEPAFFFPQNIFT